MSNVRLALHRDASVEFDCILASGAVLGCYYNGFCRSAGDLYRSDKCLEQSFYGLQTSPLVDGTIHMSHRTRTGAWIQAFVQPSSAIAYCRLAQVGVKGKSALTSGTGDAVASPRAVARNVRVLPSADR